MHCTSRRTFIKQTGLDFTAVLLPLGLVSLEKYNILEDGSFFDVIIIDGSYAVLSAGMTLGRTLKKVLIVDSGHSCNIQAPHSHNFLTQDGKTPTEIANLARE